MTNLFPYHIMKEKGSFMYVRFWELGNREVVTVGTGKSRETSGISGWIWKKAASVTSSYRLEANSAGVWGKKGNIAFLTAPLFESV